MPFYDYACTKCDKEFEVLHRIHEKPEVLCPACGKPAKKMISACGIIIHHTGAMRATRDKIRTESEARADLLENYGVEKVTPVGNQSFAEVYRGIKEQGTSVRDRMQQTREENAAKAKKKQREWAVGANRRVAKKTIAAKEKKASEAAAKRAIRL